MGGFCEEQMFLKGRRGSPPARGGERVACLTAPSLSMKNEIWVVTQATGVGQAAGGGTKKAAKVPRRKCATPFRKGGTLSRWPAVLSNFELI